MKKEMCLWEKISKGDVLRAEDVLMCIDDEEVKEMFKGDCELRAFSLSNISIELALWLVVLYKSKK